MLIPRIIWARWGGVLVHLAIPRFKGVGWCARFLLTSAKCHVPHMQALYSHPRRPSLPPTLAPLLGLLAGFFLES